MRYDIRHFHRPVCAFPGCGNEYDGDEAEWWSDPYWALDQAWEDDWLVLDGRHDEPVCICPEHLLYDGDGRLVRYDPEGVVPETAALAEFYEGHVGEPLPDPDCERGVLDALLHSGLVTADHPSLLPICEYPHCGAVFADGPFGAMWYPDEDAAETAVYDSRRWAMIKGDDGECHAFCPLHVLHDGDGRPVPVGRTVLPPALAERCTDPRPPAVRPSCADDVLDVLRGE